MARAILFVGLPGSGKTTLLSSIGLQVLVGGTVPFVYSTDDIIQSVADLSFQTYNDVFKDTIDFATKTMDKALDRHSADGTTILWDQTNLSVKKRKTAVDYLKARNYEVGCIYTKVPEENYADWSLRLLSRPGKTIPLHVIESMKASIVEPTMDEGFSFVSTFNTFSGNFKEINREGKV